MSNEESPDQSILVRQHKTGALTKPSQSMLRRALDSLPELQRILSLPDEFAIGDIYLFESDSDVLDWFIFLSQYRWLAHVSKDAIERFPEARGSIRVRRDKKIVLAVNAGEKGKLSQLKRLSPDSIDGLLLTGSIADQEFEFFAHLSGLKYFSGPRVGVSEACLNYFQFPNSLEYLDLRRSDLADTGLANLCKFELLKGLDLAGTKISDEGLAQLAILKDLRYLDLGSTNLTGTGFSTFPLDSQLTELHLDYCRDVPIGLEYISRLSRLKLLDLSNTGISDCEMIHVNKLSELRSLDLMNTNIKSTGISEIEQLYQLKELNLNFTDLNNDAMIHISKLSDLESLNIKIDNIDFEGLQHILGLENLREVWLYEDTFSDTERAEAQRRLPLCKFYWEEQSPMLGSYFIPYGRRETSIGF